MYSSALQSNSALTWYTYSTQEGNTPYSLALSGQDSETANFVMTYASKAPQKQENGPSQMTIYDLQVHIDH